jgi:hypothetical protein
MSTCHYPGATSRHCEERPAFARPARHVAAARLLAMARGHAAFGRLTHPTIACRRPMISSITSVFAAAEAFMSGQSRAARRGRGEITRLPITPQFLKAIIDSRSR